MANPEWSALIARLTSRAPHTGELRSPLSSIDDERGTSYAGG